MNRKTLVMLCTGFASGLPLYFLAQLVPAWLRNGQVDLGSIGLFSLFLISYNWKFLWSPIMDRFQLPFLGRRRGWMLVTQVLLILFCGLLAKMEPNQDISLIAAVVAVIGFLGASQDIVLDAYRRELLSDEEMGVGTSFFVNAYKAASLIPGGLSLIIADQFSWQAGIGVAVAFLLVGVVTTLLIKEIEDVPPAPQNFNEAVVEPFVEFFTRKDVHSALLILAFLFLYKLGDNMATALETPFFYDMGFTGTEIGTVAKLTKLWASVLGSFLGGYLLSRMGMAKSLWIFGFFQIGSILGYAVLSLVGNQLWMLFIAVGLEYLGVGLGTVGVLAYIAELTNKKFSATQLALLSSLVTLPRTLATATSGFIIEAIGYFHFFLLCFLLAIPGMLLLFYVAPWNGEIASLVKSESSTEDS